jgi:predicted Ser/Thr protein kinase
MEMLPPCPPLPKIPPGVTFSNFQYIAEGTHAVIYKVTVRKDKRKATRCLKIYHQGWDTPYYLETTAYAYLRRAQVEEFVPKFYGYDFRKPSNWGLQAATAEDEEPLYGILLEWLDGAKQLSEQNMDSAVVIDFMRGLTQIHNAGILHNDIFECNMLVLPSKRSVWIDFSCAKMGREDIHDQEALALAGFAIETVRNHCILADIQLIDISKERGKAEVYKGYYLSTMPMFRRLGMLVYVAWLSLEGPLHYLSKFATNRSSTPGSYIMERSLNYTILAGLVVVLLHSYIKLPKYFFRFLVLVHQVTIAGMSLWRYVYSGTEFQAETGFRLFLLCFCAVGETGGFVKEILDVNRGVSDSN